MSTIDQLIGKTPMVKLDNIAGYASIYLKLEAMNPGGSIKDRVAKAMIDDILSKSESYKDN